MRTFEYDDGKSQKFWNIELSGDSFTVTFGKLGTKGQTQTKTFPDAAKALKEHDKLVAEKVKKGYRETTLATPTPPAGEFSSPLRATLEAALEEHPDDDAAYMAYADHLHELGDPRGDFAQAQIGLEDEKLSATARKALQEREAELRKAHEAAWLGPMAEYWLEQTIEDWRRQYGHYHSLTWRRGWIDHLTIDELSDDVAKAVVAQQHLLKLIRSLSLLHRDYDDPGVATLLTGDFFANVRRFQIGSETGSCQMDGEATGQFVQRMPLLRELHTYAQRVDTEAIFAMDLPHLRELTVYHIHNYPIEVLARNESLKNLTRLSFYPHALEPDDSAAYITSAGAQAIFTSPHLTSLRHLQLRLSDAGDDGVRVLVESGLLKRLKTLDLWGGCVTDDGARLLAACPDLGNLERLDLTHNMIGADGAALLKAAGVAALEVGEQFDPSMLGSDELEYLWYGDCE